MDRIDRTGEGAGPPSPEKPKAASSETAGSRGASFAEEMEKQSRLQGEREQEKTGTDQGSRRRQDGKAEEGGGMKGEGLFTAPPLPPAGGPQAVKAAGRISPHLIDRIVESVRVGTNRAGDREVQIDLKASAFEGMNVRVSGGQEGVHVTLAVEQFAVKSALEARLSELTAKLEASGVRVADVHVEFKPPPGGQPFTGAGGGESSEGDAGSSGFGEGPGGAGPEGPAGGPPRPGPRTDESSTDYTV